MKREIVACYDNLGTSATTDEVARHLREKGFNVNTDQVQSALCEEIYSRLDSEHVSIAARVLDVLIRVGATAEAAPDDYHCGVARNLTESASPPAPSPAAPLTEVLARLFAYHTWQERWDRAWVGYEMKKQEWLAALPASDSCPAEQPATTETPVEE